MSDSAMSKFSSCRSLEYYDGDFDPNKYFEEHHHFEEYVATNEYQKDNFVATYRDNTPRTYLNTLYKIVFKKDSLPCNKKYVVAIEVVSPDDLNKMKKFCQCSRCKLPWYSIITRFSMCSCCYGCLKSSMYQQFVVNDTRAYMLKNGKY